MTHLPSFYLKSCWSDLPLTFKLYTVRHETSVRPFSNWLPWKSNNLATVVICTVGISGWWFNQRSSWALRLRFGSPDARFWNFAEVLLDLLGWTRLSSRPCLETSFCHGAQTCGSQVTLSKMYEEKCGVFLITYYGGKKETTPSWVC